MDLTPGIPRYSILIVGFRSLRFLEDCFRSLLATEGPSHEILFLDNASPEPEADWVEAHCADPRVRVFRSPRNLLFAGGMNFLAREARGGALLLLNPDTRVAPDWLIVLDAARSRGGWEAAQLDIRTVSDPSRHESQGPHLDRLGFTHHAHRPGAVEPFRVFSGRGAGVMIDREWFLKLGGLDEDMGMYFEETDFFWRLNIAGGKVYFVPGAKIFHVRGGSSRDTGFDWRTFRFTRNRIGSLAKNLEIVNLCIFLPAHLLIYALRFPLLLLALRGRKAAAEAAALAAAIARLPIFLAKRGQVARLRKVRDAELLARGLLIRPSKPLAVLARIFGRGTGPQNVNLTDTGTTS